MKIQVNLYKTKKPDGWAASIASYSTKKGAPNEVAIGESIIFADKAAAWKSIQKEAKDLDYENDEVHFNHKKVSDYADLLSEVDSL